MNNQNRHAILVVDDEAGIRNLLKKNLMSWNYRVISAENGRRALPLIQSDSPDLVLTDLFMPEADGFEVLRCASDKSPILPVVVMSGQGQMKDAVQALRLGAWDYIYKPINMSFLRLTIERSLEKATLIQENYRYRNHLEELVEQQNAELSASEKRFRTVADFTYDWEYWIDPNGNFVYNSPSCERITGYSSHEFLQNPSLLRKIVHPDNREVFNRHIDDYQHQREVTNIEFRIIRRDGEQCWIGHCCQPVYDSKNDYLGRRCSNRDISCQKNLEMNLIKQKEALIERTTSLEKTNEALKALLDRREIEKKSIEQSMVINLKRFVFPYLDDLEKQKNSKDTMAYINIIRTNIEQLVSPVSKSLSGAYLDLTPMEIRVADLIRQGTPTKSIADMLNISSSTVEKHRNKIRKKLNILNKRINLQTYLGSLT